jgi:hypothetical protein
MSSVSADDGKPLKIYVWENRLKDGDVKEVAAAGGVARRSRLLLGSRLSSAVTNPMRYFPKAGVI